MNTVEFAEKYLNLKFYPYEKQLLKWLDRGGKIFFTKPYSNVQLTSIYEISRLLLEERKRYELENSNY